MTSSPAISTSRRRTSGGPNPAILAVVSLGLTVCSIIVGTLLSGGQVFVSPLAGTDAVAAYFQQNPYAVRITALLQLGSAVPLGLLTATVYARQLRLGIRVAGPVIGLYGGTTASIMLMISAATTWVLSHTEISSNAFLTHALSFFAFITGGVGYVVGLGLLVAGLAVPALILRLIPRWLAWTGLVLAALSELSFLSMVFEPLQILLPIGRFGGLLWLVITGFLLPTKRNP